MALFKIFKGNVENLPLDKHEGYAYFTEDTKELYIDIDNNTRVQVNAEKLSRTIDNSTETIEIDDILELQDHLINKNNPHETTAEQVGADPTGSAQSALRSAMSYVNEKIAEIPTPDVSAQIEEHNTSLTAHANRNWVSAEDDGEIGDTIPINADTLNGKPGSDYALKEDLKAQTISFTSSVGATGTNVQQAIDELFTSASNGKELIADAITGKGIPTSADSTYSTMAENIEKIETGIDISDATLTAASELKKDIVAYSKTGKRIVGSLGQGTVNKPSISVSSAGEITASTSYTSGIIGQSTVSNTSQLDTQAETTITPGTSKKTAVATGKYTTGPVYVEGDENLEASNIKSGVSIFGVSGTAETIKYKSNEISSIFYDTRELSINFKSLSDFTKIFGIFLYGDSGSCYGAISVSEIEERYGVTYIYPFGFIKIDNIIYDLSDTSSMQISNNSISIKIMSPQMYNSGSIAITESFVLYS